MPMKTSSPYIEKKIEFNPICKVCSKTFKLGESYCISKKGTVFCQEHYYTGSAIEEREHNVRSHKTF